MPTLWRYLLKQFFKVFLLTVTSFIFILFITRLKEIARIIALTPKVKYIFLFILNIIPYILPIAIPIACLLSAVLLYQRLSQSHELTALRCGGFSLYSLIFPVLSAGALLACVNFYVISEMTTQSQLFAKKLINELITQNPFYLMEQRNRLKLRDYFVDMQIEERGKSASNLFFIAPDRGDHHLNLISIKKIQVKKDQIYAPAVSVVTHIPSNESEKLDHLAIENEKNLRTSASDLSKLIKNSHFHLYSHHCSMPFLLIRLQKAADELKHAKASNDYGRVKDLKKKMSQDFSEIAKRFSIGICVFTFTLLGISYSIEIGRNRTRKNFLIMVSLAIFSLICLFTGKIFKNPIATSTIYLIPHVLIIVASMIELRKVARGIE